jgi:GNAT superfamily N-acetyltransferase
MIRQGTLDDQEHLLDLGERMHAESIYSSLTFNREKARKELHWSLRNGSVFVFESKGKPEGLIMGHAKAPWFSDDSVGYEETLYLSPEHRGGRNAALLIKAWEKWCIDHGVKLLRPTTSCGSFRAERLYTRMNFVPVGSTFFKEV